MKTLLTLDVLKTMSSDELEDYRAAGEDFRRELSHAVMRDLTSPSGWSVNAEYRCEFGGFFPVQIRFTPSHGHFDVAVCSPGELNPRWIVVFVTRDGQPFSVVRVMDAFNPELTQEKKAMKLPRNTLLGCVLIVCLTLLIFTYLTRKSLCEIRYRDTNREVAAFLAYESAK